MNYRIYVLRFYIDSSTEICHFALGNIVTSQSSPCAPCRLLRPVNRTHEHCTLHVFSLYVLKTADCETAANLRSSWDHTKPNWSCRCDSKSPFNVSTWAFKLWAQQVRRGSGASDLTVLLSSCVALAKCQCWDLELLILLLNVAALSVKKGLDWSVNKALLLRMRELFETSCVETCPTGHPPDHHGHDEA